MVGTELLTDWPPERPMVHRIFTFSVEIFLPWKHQFFSFFSTQVPVFMKLTTDFMSLQLVQFCPLLKRGELTGGRKSKQCNVVYFILWKPGFNDLENFTHKAMKYQTPLTKLCDKHCSQSYEIPYKYEISYKHKRWNCFMPIISSSTNVCLMDSATKNYCICHRKHYNLRPTCAIISKLKLFHETLEHSMLVDTTYF